MNEYFLAVVLGIIEGFTEFLPISSTAHLRIAQYFIGISLDDEFWKLFAVFIQLGAILAVVVYFRKKLWLLCRSFWSSKKKFSSLINHPFTLVMAAFAVTALPAFLLHKIIGKNLESLWIMASSLIIGGIIMWIVDVLCKKPTTIDFEKTRWPQALWIGLIQITAAVFPGTSRSMSTIAAAQIAGLSRSAALEFSFFLSIPTMIAATCYDFLKFLKMEETITFSPHQLSLLFIGTIVSFIVALAVIAWFLYWVKSRGFIPFAAYRIFLGIILIILLK